MSAFAHRKLGKDLLNLKIKIVSLVFDALFCFHVSFLFLLWLGVGEGV